MKNQTTTRRWSLLIIALLTLNLSTLAQEAFSIGSVSISDNTQDLSKLPKMERDIIILQNVLDDLFNGGENRLYALSGAKGIYVPGKGVIFNLGGGNNSLAISRFFASRQTHAEAKKENDKSSEQKNAENEARIKALSKDFLVNYGSILSNLKSGEKVMLNINYPVLKETDSKEEDALTISEGASVIYRGGRISQKRIVSSIDYSTIDSYLSGKSSLESAESKVSQRVVEANANESQDAKIMAGILDDLFQSNFDGIYRRSGKTSWTYFEGFGLMYNLNLSGARSGMMRFSGQTTVTGTVTGTIRTNQDKPERTEEEQKMEANFDDLMGLVKESLITYGRTLRSIKTDEVIIINISFGSSFRKTDLPKAVRIQVKKSQIEAYSKGKKTLDELKNEIDITKMSASAASFGANHFPEAIMHGALPEIEAHFAEAVHNIKSAAKSN